MADTADDLIDRRTFLEKLKISDSSERRRRARQRGWPAHLRIGSKIYYRTSVVDEWVRQQEAVYSAPLHVPDKADSDSTTAVLRLGKVLTDAALPLTPHQIELLRTLFGRPEEVASDE